MYLNCGYLSLIEMFLLSTTNDNSESKNSLASGRILNFLNSFLHEALLLVPAIILMIFFWMKNIILLSVECPQKITPYDIMEWKKAK
jgi:hypothetical protein